MAKHAQATICIIVVFLAAHMAGLAYFRPASAQSPCFNNPLCSKPQIPAQRSRGKTTTTSWDMDSGSFSSEWAWIGTAPGVNFEDAVNNASFEWTRGNLTWDQRDSCSQAKGTGNTAVCVGVRNWCKWVRSLGVSDLLITHGRTRTAFQLGCDLPAGWDCIRISNIRFNGFDFWKDSECGIGTVTVGAPINPAPGDTSDPRLRVTCQGRALPTIASKPNIRHVAVHEFGHTLRLVHSGVSCTPSQTVMEEVASCPLLLPCPIPFVTASDDIAVRFLYGP